MATLTFWLNAFIPRDVPDYTIQLTKGIHAGKTAIPLPGAARTWPGNMFKHRHCGYLTDQRSFFDSPTSSIRMRSRADVDVSANGLTLVSTVHETSGTTQVNTETGEQTGFAKADLSRCTFVAVKPAIAGGGAFPKPMTAADMGATKTLTLKLAAAAGDPLVGMAADIDYTGSLDIGPGPLAGTLRVAFSGLIDSFPAYDCYASYNGVTKPLFKVPPPKGNTVMDLLGSASTPAAGTVTFP